MAIETHRRIAGAIASEIGARPDQVAAAAGLLDGGATVPFVARYRKEATGGLDDTQLRTLADRLAYLRELEARREAILGSIREQGKLTPALESQVAAAETKAVLEDLYLPFKPKRRTKAMIARERGLGPLAEAILADRRTPPETLAAAYLSGEVPDVKEALAGARDILTEQLGEDAALLGRLRTFLQREGVLSARLVKGQEEKGAKFSDYFAHSERWSGVPSHRALAMMRGANEGVLTLDIGPDPAGLPQVEAMVEAALGVAGDAPGDRWLKETARWAWRVKLGLSMMLDLMGDLRERAQDEAIRVFARNLKALLLAAPAGARPTMGLDPGVRTGVKVAVVDATGKLLATDTVYPFQPRNDVRGAQAALGALIRQHGVELIAIGNGTASRETERLVAELLALLPGSAKPTKVVVSEAGASVYSASELGSKEFPDLDVSLRGAVSIARRLQDPLAELVKIEPKAIGVGQYQHDVDQHRLGKSLEAVVEDAVNAVGVDLNTASAPLLAHVSGLGPSLAEAIVAHRNEKGAFRSRKELLSVARLGPRAFEQAAGFLRIRDGAEPLDASAVHPEAYDVARRIVKACGRDLRSLMGDEARLQGRRSGRFRRCALRPADGAGHSRRARQAGARSATGLRDRDLPGRCREDLRPEARDAAGGNGDERRGLRRLRRHRRAPGRAGARLPARRSLREGPARGGEGGRRGEGAGARGRRAAQADQPLDAQGHRGPRRADGEGAATIGQAGARTDAKTGYPASRYRELWVSVARRDEAAVDLSGSPANPVDCDDRPAAANAVRVSLAENASSLSLPLSSSGGRMAPC